MTKTQRRKSPLKGSSKPVEVTVGNKAQRAFLVGIENNGRDALGRVVGANGIAWKVG